MPGQTTASAKSALEEALFEERDTEAIEWMKTKAKEEETRLKEHGIKPLLMMPKNCSIVYQDDHTPPLVVNRVELSSNFDFQNRIKQIMVADPVAYTLKEGYLYVNVLMFTENMTLPFLMPYVYDSKITNNLKEWMVINSSGMRARHAVHQYHHLS